MVDYIFKKIYDDKKPCRFDWHAYKDWMNINYGLRLALCDSTKFIDVGATMYFFEDKIHTYTNMLINMVCLISRTGTKDFVEIVNRKEFSKLNNKFTIKELYDNFCDDEGNFMETFFKMTEYQFKKLILLLIATDVIKEQ